MHPSGLIRVNRWNLGGVTCSGAGQTSKSSSVINPKMPHASLKHLSLSKEGSSTVSPRMSNLSTESTWKTANVSLNHWSTTGKQPSHMWALGSCPRPLNSYSSGSWPRSDYFSNGKKTTHYLIPVVDDYMLMMQVPWTLQSAGGICC